MRFIDLFAGLGGFHLALRELGHQCVFASEIDASLRDLYKSNFGLKPAGDIREVSLADIPEHEILCAGFPCQPFSKAGSQQGFEDPRNGDLFTHVLRIIDQCGPRYVLLENVPNLRRHGNGDTWLKLSRDLSARGYDVGAKHLSPHDFGIPQIRDRVFIVGSRESKGLWGFQWPEHSGDGTEASIRTFLDQEPQGARPITAQARRCLEVWQEFLARFPEEESLPAFPIWSMEFGATYPYKTTTPWAIGASELRNYRGSHGRVLSGLSNDEVMAALPSHARREEARFPRWKVTFIRQNRELYEKHKAWLDDWLPAILEFPSSYQKLEWNCKGEARDIWQFVIQFRPSGVRLKRPTTAPSLVAMTATQVPIIAWESRYLTPHEGAKLQSLGQIELPDKPTKAFEALGNAVNVKLASLVAEALVGRGDCLSVSHCDRRVGT